VRVPVGARTHLLATRSLARIAADDPAERQRGLEWYRLLRSVRGLGEIADAYQAAADPTRKQRLSEAFLALTGQRIEDWLAQGD
jgi:hypothetical protein